MSLKQAVLVGCVVVLLLALGSCVALVLLAHHVSQPPENVGVVVASPEKVTVGQEFVLTVSVQNTREEDPFELTDIDIAEEYLAGFTILSTDPAEVPSEHLPIDDTRSFHFNVSIAAGETRDFAFRLRPLQEGLFRGDVDVCESLQFLTTMAQTSVVAEAPEDIDDGIEPDPIRPPEEWENEPLVR